MLCLYYQRRDSNVSDAVVGATLPPMVSRKSKTDELLGATGGDCIFMGMLIGENDVGTGAGDEPPNARPSNKEGDVVEAVGTIGKQLRQETLPQSHLIEILIY